jgi:DNA excision repair protein ERCC-4
MIPPRVVVDEREKQSGVPDKLSKLNVRVYFSNLPIADYVINPEIAIERKSLSDFISSIYDGRLFIQASEISSAYRKPYLIVEGDVKEVRQLTRNINSYYGAITSVTLAYDLRIMHTASQDETAIAIAEMIKNSRARKIQGQAIRVAPKAKDLPQQQLYFVSSLPGVGSKLAKRLLTRFGTPRQIVKLTGSQLALVPRFGWKKAEKVIRMLDTKYIGQKDEPVQERLE